MLLELVDMSAPQAADPATAYPIAANASRAAMGTSNRPLPPPDTERRGAAISRTHLFCKRAAVLDPGHSPEAAPLRHSLSQGHKAAGA